MDDKINAEFISCGQCLNGQCRNISNCQYYCECNPGYTGTFCDVLLPTMPISTTPIPSVVNTMQISPRCNFSIGLYNDGAFATRFIVEYKIEGVVQPYRLKSQTNLGCLISYISYLSIKLINALRMLTMKLASHNLEDCFINTIVYHWAVWLDS